MGQRSVRSVENKVNSFKVGAKAKWEKAGGRGGGGQVGRRKQKAINKKSQKSESKKNRSDGGPVLRRLKPQAVA